MSYNAARRDLVVSLHLRCLIFLIKNVRIRSFFLSLYSYLISKVIENVSSSIFILIMWSSLMLIILKTIQHGGCMEVHRVPALFTALSAITRCWRNTSSGEQLYITLLIQHGLLWLCTTVLSHKTLMCTRSLAECQCHCKGLLARPSTWKSLRVVFLNILKKQKGGLHNSNVLIQFLL